MPVARVTSPRLLHKQMPRLSNIPYIGIFFSFVCFAPNRMAACDSENRKQRKRKRPLLSLKCSKKNEETSETTEAPNEEPVPPIPTLPSLPTVFQKWRMDKNKDMKGCEGDSDGRASPPPPFSALNNVGNTCYINSVLQILRYCPRFVESLKKVGRETVKCDQMDDHPSGVDTALPSCPQQQQLASKLCKVRS